MTFRTLLIVGVGSAALIAQEEQTFAGDNHQPGRGAAIASVSALAMSHRAAHHAGKLYRALLSS